MAQSSASSPRSCPANPSRPPKPEPSVSPVKWPPTCRGSFPIKCTKVLHFCAQLYWTMTSASPAVHTRFYFRKQLRIQRDENYTSLADITDLSHSGTYAHPWLHLRLPSRSQ